MGDLRGAGGGIMVGFVGGSEEATEGRKGAVLRCAALLQVCCSGEGWMHGVIIVPNKGRRR